MLTAERKRILLERLRTDGRLVAKDLAAELDVSHDTIRRDLRELAAEGLVQRVHGGALPASPALAPYPARQQIGADAKSRVADLAVGLIEPGQTVVLDGGTTALAVARSLPAGLAATIVTHSPTIAAALADHPTVDVLVIGGKLFKHSVVTVGAIATEAIQAIQADASFIGVTGVHPTGGLTTGDADEAAIKRAFARRSADTYVLASSEKLGAVSPHTVVPWNHVTAVLTDAPASHPTVRALRRKGVTVICAGRAPR